MLLGVDSVPHRIAGLGSGRFIFEDELLFDVVERFVVDEAAAGARASFAGTAGRSSVVRGVVEIVIVIDLALGPRMLVHDDNFVNGRALSV